MRHLLRPACAVIGLAVCLVLSACAGPSAARAPGPLERGCTLTKRAELPLRDARNFMLAPVGMDGQPVSLVVDTGAEATTVTPAAAARLRLQADAGHSSVLRGVAGTVRSQNVRVHALALDGHVLQIDKSLGVGELPAFPGIVPPVSGLLGSDVLARYELELDLPARRMALYSASGCATYKPWPGAVAVPIEHTRSGLAFVAATVNGRQVHALVDTGARTTLITRATALTLGVSEAAMASDVSHSGVGFGPASIAFRQHRFERVGLPGDQVAEMTVSIADLHLPGVEMLLGADYWGMRHLWISYATDRLFAR